MKAKTTLEFTHLQLAEILTDYVRTNFPALKAVDASKVKWDINPGVSGGHSQGYSAPSLRSGKIELDLDLTKI